MTKPSGQVSSAGFLVLHGNRLEDLRELLVNFVKAHPLGPLEPERILVQSNGMKHWLEMALADEQALGICAATRLELPATVLWQMYRQVLGAQAVPMAMPFDKSRLLWRLVRLLPTLAQQHLVYAPLQRYLGAKVDARKLYQLAVQVADVLDGYQTYRADWLSDWASGCDVLRAAPGTSGQPAPALPEVHAWQAQLWRDVRADLDAPLRDASRAQVHQRFVAALQTAALNLDGRRAFGLPQRLVVFGVSSLSTQTIEALAALARHCQVLMLVQNPCQYYWADLWSTQGLARSVARHPTKPNLAHQLLAPEQRAWQQPLLAAWGQQGRDYLHLLSSHDQTLRHQAALQRIDVFVDPVAGLSQPSQLAQVQSSILNLEPAPEPKRKLAPDDASITLVSAHSAQREVEILHDQLLAWLEADADLQPRDVMVMVPDMALFAPHIQAVFGRFAPGQPRHMPFSLADATGADSSVLRAVRQLLALPGSRISLTDGLNLLELDVVRQRFELSSGDVDQLKQWLEAAGVRWGLDAAHRQAWGMPEGMAGLDQNTWAFGLRRLLLGYALGPQSEGVWQATLAQAAWSGLDAGLAGKLLTWLDAVQQSLDALSDEQTPEAWGETLRALVTRFLAPTDAAQERHIQQLLETLELWQQHCAEAAMTSPLPLQVVAEHWLGQLQDQGLWQRFFGAGVQFATLMPMRTIPFKRVCLLGMNDGVYPRPSPPRDFDLMAQSWRAGDRSRREDDRYLFLEAVLSAREALYISWQGRRASDNAEQPPSVLVAQLMDFLNSGWQRPCTVVQHPLQPFSPSYWQAGSGLFSYDADWASLHQPVSHQVEQAPPALAQPAPIQALTREALQRLLRKPAEVFFRSRLGVWLPPLPEPAAEEEVFTLDHLARHQAGAVLLEAADLEVALEALRCAGALPMAAFGAEALAQLLRDVNQVRTHRQGWLEAYPELLPAQAVEVKVQNSVISASLEGLRARPGQSSPGLQLQQRIGRVSEGKSGALHARGHVVAGLWVDHVLACASGLPLTSVQLGVDHQVVLQPLDQSQAQAVLERWLQAYIQAWSEPLPVGVKTAWAFLQAWAKSQGQSDEQGDGQAASAATAAHGAAAQAFDGDTMVEGERIASPYLARAFEDYDDIAHALPAWADVLYGELARRAQVQPLGQVIP